MIDKEIKWLLLSNFLFKFISMLVFISIFTFWFTISRMYAINMYLPNDCVIFALPSGFMCKNFVNIYYRQK